MPSRHDHAMVIGTGLGGLLAGAFLAGQGRPITFLEALDFIGGRFTHIDYEGFAVPTGAFHALPGGAHGPLAACMRRLGIPLDLAEPNPALMVISQGQAYPLHYPPFQGRNAEVRKALQIRKKWLLMLRGAGYALGGLFGREYSVAAWFRGLGPSDLSERLADHVTQFSFGVPAAQTATSYIVRSLRTMRGAFGEGFLRGGNRALVTSLLEYALARGATLRTRTPAARILVEDGRCVGVETEAGERLAAATVISNAGIHRTARLLGDYAPPAFIDHARRVRPAYGAGHAIRSRRRLHAHNGIEMTVDLPHIAGIAPISNLCPALCPPGWHFSLAYQVLDAAQPVEPQVEAAHRELAAYFGPDAEIFNTATYCREHPAAAIAPCLGQHGAARFAPAVPGVAGCYLAGEDVAGYGFAAEIIGDSTQRLWRLLEGDGGGER